MQSMLCRYLVLLSLLSASPLFSQQPIPLSNLNATADDALYTTYAASMSRSEYFVDEGYHLKYYSSNEPVKYTTDFSGDFALGWRLGELTALTTADYFRKPVIRRSYTDIAEIEYWPFTTIEIREVLVVYSSRIALVDIQITNHSNSSQEVQLYAYYQNSQSVSDVHLSENNYVLFHHIQDAKTISESTHPQYQKDRRDLFMLSEPADTSGGYSQDDMLREIAGRSALNGQVKGELRGIALSKTWTLSPQEQKTVRIVRGVQQWSDDSQALIAAARRAISQPIAPLIAESEAQYKDIPRLKLPSQDWELAYWSAFSLVRQQMMPGEGERKHNYTSSRASQPGAGATMGRFFTRA
jgi:hypothetical protein